MPFGETQYRREPSFLELLQQAQMAGGAPPQAPATPTVMSSGAEQAIAKLQELAFAPDPEEPAPKEPGLGAKIGMGLGDALRTYAALNSGMVPPPSFLGEAKARSERNKATAAQQRKERAGAKREEARFLLGRELAGEDRRQIAADALAGKKELQAAALEQQKAAADQAAIDRRAQRDLQLELQKMKDANDLAVAKAQGEYQQGVARINGNIDKTQARLDKKEVGEAVTFIGQTALNAKKMLAEGRTTDDIRRVVKVTLDGLTLGPDQEKVVMAYAMANLEPVLREHDMSQQPQQGPQDQPVLDQLGKTATPWGY